METVQRTIVLDAPVDEVWAALTDPLQLSAWFGALVDLDVRPGGGGRFVTDAGEVREAMVVRVEPRRHLTFQWWPVGHRAGVSTTRVSFDVDDQGGRTRLTVIERGIVRPGGTGPKPVASLCA